MRPGPRPTIRRAPARPRSPPGETIVTTVTFPSTGSLLFGCHLPGHYAYGMRGMITIA